MKKLLFLNLILLIFIALLFCGCLPAGETTTDDSIKSISVTTSSPDSFILGADIDFSKIEIKVNYTDGTSEIIALKETMLSDSDRQKFTTVGAAHSVVINYKTKTALYNFEVIKPITVEKYNVYFVSNGGSDVDSQNVSNIEVFTMPTKPGYTFLGWYDNVDCAGIAAVAPLEINREVTFYAKWEDNRKWSVTFRDIIGNIIESYTQMITHGEDVVQLPNAPIVDGYTFKSWIGQQEDITANTVIQATYERILCTVNFYYNYGELNQTISPKIIPWGDALVQNDILPFVDKEGYNGKWYILTGPDEYEEISDQFDRITTTIYVIPVYKIKTYNLTFQDDSAFTEAGEAWTNIIKTVNYGADLVLNSGENANISEPQYRIGHKASWAVFIDGVWTNINDGSTWDEENSEWIPLIVPVTLLELKNVTNDTIATVVNSTFEEIKANIQVQAKYVKDEYTLSFIINNTDGTVLNYSQSEIKYGSRYSLYKTENTVSGVIYGRLTKKEFVYKNALDDWDLEWYSRLDYEEGDDTYRINFDSGNVSVTKDMIYYGVPIDLRIYTVEFYDWDFENEISVQLSSQEIPHGSDAVIPSVSNKMEFGYAVIDTNNYWYDAPQDKPYGEQVSTTKLNSDMTFYAHYKIKSYSITFKDYYYPYDDFGNAEDMTVLSKSPAVTYYYDEVAGEYLYTGYVAMEASFFREFGYVFADGELYFGGDEVYGNKLFIEQYEADLPTYNLYSADMTNIKAAIARYTAYLQEIFDYEEAVLAYTTTPEAKERYIILKPNYDVFRARLYEAQEKLNFVNEYKIQYYAEGDFMPSGALPGDENLNTGSREREYMLLKYVRATDAEGDYILDKNGNYTYVKNAEDYIDNGNYQRYCNLIYQNTGRTGYEFDGWYTSPGFSSSAKVSTVDESEAITTSVTVSNNIILYAKWIDLNKGSDGLVFLKKQKPNPNYTEGGTESEFIDYYEVMDYIYDDEKSTDYKLSDDRWCSELYEREILGYDETRVNITYDDCNPFGMIAGDFGEITSLSKHTFSESASNSTISAFNSLSKLFATFMGKFEIPTNDTEYIPTISSDALDSYTLFYNKAIELYNSSLVSFTKNISNDLTRSAVIGVNHPYTMAFGSDISPELINFQTVIANLFGFISKEEFMDYAQDLANTYAQHRANITNSANTNEALENGCFYTDNGSFVFPIAVKNELSSNVLAYVVLDASGLVSVWVNDITAALWATNFNSSHHTTSIINNELYCKNIFFVTGRPSYVFTDPTTGESRTVSRELISFNALSDNAADMETEVKIPSFHDGLPVTEVANGIFGKNNAFITSVDIPKNVELVAEGAFAACTNLLTITVADENLFYEVNNGVLYTENLTVLVCYPAKLVIPDYIYDALAEIPVIVPSTTFIVPATVERIAAGAFNSCIGLTHMVIDTTMDTIYLTIGEEAFKGCGELLFVGGLAESSRIKAGSNPEETELIYISNSILPDRVRSIESRAFAGCVKITDISASMTSILIYVGEDILSDTSWYDSRSVYAQNTKYLDGASSGGIIMLGYVALGVTSDFSETVIDFSAEFVRAIADSAFYNNTEITKVNIKCETFQYIGEMAFRNCASLSTVEIHSGTPCEIGMLAFGGIGNYTIFVPMAEGVEADYEAAEGWDDYAEHIEIGGF